MRDAYQLRGRPAGHRPPPWRDIRLLKVIGQAIFLLLLAIVVVAGYLNLRANLFALNMGTSFSFLNQPAGFEISGSDFRQSQTMFAAFMIGASNTVKVALSGIVLASLFGLLIGLGRLSSNWLVRKAAIAYVEVFRNIPVLLIILFCYLGLVLQLPAEADAVRLGDLIVLSNKGVSLPWWGAGDQVVLSGQFTALLLGLVFYTASHIAEVVRASILAVPRGQSEAANALGLSDRQRLRLVVLPQALRIMIPPLANQYLNLTKNSSLAVAIAFPEVSRIVNIAIGQRAPAPQAVVVLMGFYLAISLSIALVTNVVNWRIGLRGAR